MKKVLVVLSMVIVSIATQAQKDFKWDVVIDSLDNNKSELYSKTKLFITETWNSAQEVVQNYDKDGGVFVIKGEYGQMVTHRKKELIWVYEYTVIIFVRDNKCRIIIKDVNYKGEDNYATPLTDSNPLLDDMKVSEYDYSMLIKDLKEEILFTVELYSEYLVDKSNPLHSDW